MKEVGFYCLFGELKAGDKFAYQGANYEKISGNLADLTVNGKIVRTEEIPPDAKVYVWELY